MTAKANKEASTPDLKASLKVRKAPVTPAVVADRTPRLGTPEQKGGGEHQDLSKY